MTTKRRRIGPRKIGRVEPWVVDLLERHIQPGPDDEGSDGFFGWYFCGDEIPGLPLADSEEGHKITRRMKLRKRRAA